MCNEYCIVWITTKDYFIAIVIRPDQGMAKQELQYLILVALHLLKGLDKLFILCQLALFHWLANEYDFMLNYSFMSSSIWTTDIEK